MSFRDQLETAAFKYPIQNARLIKLLNKGRKPRKALENYAFGLHRMAVRFPATLVKLIEITPEPAVKYHLLENLMEEDGIFVRPGVGLRVNEAARHVNWARRFAVAVGITEENLNAPVSGYPDADLDLLIKKNRWLDTLSYLLIGFEANTPRTFEAILPGLRKLGYTERELTFFTAHIAADMEHGGAALDLVAAWAKTPEQQASALACAAKGAEAWWHRHNGASAVAYN